MGAGRIWAAAAWGEREPPAETDVTAFDAVLGRLSALHPKTIDLSLQRIDRLLARLGDPQRSLPPVIHVAGTNGKGSTIAFLRAILEAAGRRVHVYTSPHLVRFNERFRLGQAGGGRLVSDDELESVLGELERANAGQPITVFEIITAAGFVLFARHPADVVLLEVGMGGRYDATNVIERPAVSVITPVSLDHVDYLGTTIEEIAREKAGILKRRVPAVVARQPLDALEVIERQAARLAAPLFVSGEQWHAHEEGGRLVFQDEDGLLDLPRPRLIGRHQIENAGTAIAALRAGKFALPMSAYEAGVAAADWPARLQRLGAGRLIRLLPAGAELWLDGGHNAGGGEVVAATLADLEERAPKPLALVCGMLDTKEPEPFLRHFAGLARRLVAVPVPGHERGRPPGTLVEAAGDLGFEADAAENVEAALARLATAFEDAPRVLVTGSLYLAGDVLARDGTFPT
ncbi:bifunctional folylpolyglutamate synthase/dihydrofolate synthase [Blastochloris sulfoviridis]|uniref:tetrahydrofolate synthase n=1 Tax=Blastochloris sulfoviridis TaxID=50712 RepID=A0A5M6I2G1_9HYPH|nr:bifunctional folylpolyglutamate synthase/dihydrofolate synthase [Blastochloris sulfoviridis]